MSADAAVLWLLSLFLLLAYLGLKGKERWIWTMFILVLAGLVYACYHLARLQ